MAEEKIMLLSNNIYLCLWNAPHQLTRCQSVESIKFVALPAAKI